MEAFESVVYHPQPIQGYVWKEEEEKEGKISIGEEQVVVITTSEKTLEQSCNAGDVSLSSSSSSSSSLGNDDSSTSSSSSYGSTSSSSSSSSTSSSSLSHHTNHENDNDNDDDDDDDGGGKGRRDHWNTYKQTQIEHNRIPRAFLFHLKRFEYHNGRVQKVSTNLDVPMEIHLSPYLHHQQQPPPQNQQQRRTDGERDGGNDEPQSTSSFSDRSSASDTYFLRGAVVHIDHPKERNQRRRSTTNPNRNRTKEDDSNDHCGHYIAYCAPRWKTDPTSILQQSNNNNNSYNDDEKTEGKCTHTQQLWIKADDDRITPFLVRSEENIENNNKPNLTKPPNGAKGIDTVTNKRSPIVVVPKRSFLKVLSGGGGGSIGGNRAAVLLLYTARCDVMD